MLKSKWAVLAAFVALYSIGITGVAWHTYGVTIPPAQPAVETIKIIFIMLGGLGVIVPTYLNVWQSLETARLLEDQVRRSKVENTFDLLERWDDKSLFEARKFTRDLKDEHSKISADDLRKRVTGDPSLRQSVILLFNYFELVRVSAQHDRIDLDIMRQSLGNVFVDLYERFRPWIRDQDSSYQKDLESLFKLLAP